MNSDPIYIQLEIPYGEKQKSFYAYINSALSKRFIQSESAFKDLKEGGFQSEFIANLGENSSWKFIFNSDPQKTLQGVKISYFGDLAAPETWQTQVREILHAALAAAFSEKVSSFFMRRKLYYIGPELDGEYWFGNIRFAPAEEIPSNMPAVRWERAVHLDFTIKAIDNIHAMYLANQFERSFSARLSLLLDVDLYPHSHSQIWIKLPNDGGNARCSRGHDDVVQLQNLPQKGEACSLGNTAPISRLIFATEKLKIPKEARRFLKAVDNQEKSKQQAIDGAARLYQIGLSLKSRFPSAALAYCVAAIDAISSKVSECKVKDFLNKYSPLSKTYPEIASQLWGSFRSAHFHSGEFGLGEFTEQRLMDMIIDADTAAKIHVEFRSEQIVREAIVNWITELSSNNAE